MDGDVTKINETAPKYIEKIAKICKEKKPLVAIHCLTYNHASYLRDALEGFLMQKTNFPFVAIVHEDASTDKTADIVKEYADKYPDIILPIFEEENLYSMGGFSLISTVMNKAIEATGAKYIAMCEGDDYWIDTLKLQKQVEAMETHSGVDACTHKQIQYDAITKEKLRIKTHGEQIKILSLKDVILREGGFVGTNTMMYRSECFLQVMPFRAFMDYDYTEQIQSALRGGILYIPECEAAYNANVPNSFCSRMYKNYEAQKIYIQNKMKMLDILNEDTNFVYQRIIAARKLLYTVSAIAPFSTNLKYFYKYHCGFKELPFVEKIKTLFRISVSCIGFRIYQNKMKKKKMATVQNDLSDW